MNVMREKKGLSFISKRQRRKEGTFCASELAGIEPKRAGYVRLDHSATFRQCNEKNNWV